MKKDWIKRLPPGEYTMRQILEFSGLSGSASARIIMLKYGAEVHSLPVEGHNFNRHLFIWKGFKPLKKEKNK